MKKLFLLTACAALLWLVQACSSASEATMGADTAATDTSSVSTPGFIPDTVFMAKAAIGGMAEVELGNMAMAKSTNENVKSVANMIVEDHKKANEELMTIAKEKNFVLPTTLDAEHQAMSDNLRDLTGTAFDKAYIDAMVTAHQKNLDMMQDESEHAADAKLKDFATKTSPVIQMHLQQVQKVQGGIK